MAERTLKYRDLMRCLKLFGVYEDKSRGKGSERLLVRIVGATKLCIPTKCHHEGDQKPRAMIGAILPGRPVNEVGREIFEEILAVASGRKTKSGVHGIGDEEFVPWPLGPTL